VPLKEKEGVRGTSDMAGKAQPKSFYHLLTGGWGGEFEGRAGDFFVSHPPALPSRFIIPQGFQAQGQEEGGHAGPRLRGWGGFWGGE